MDSSCDRCGKEHWTLPVRLIRSFEYRTFRTLVMKDVCREMTTDDFVEHLREEMASAKSVPKAFLKHDFDCVKILHKPHSFKTNNPLINLDHDDWILPTAISLDGFGVVNETELTYFKRTDYETYKANPVHLTT